MSDEGRAVLKIPVDTSEWDAFLASVTKYREMAKNMPHARLGGAGAEKTPATSFTNVAATAKKLSADPTLTGRSSFIVSFAKSSDDAEKSWLKISKSVGATARSMSVLGRIGVGFSAFGNKLAAGATGVAAAGFGAVVGAANDLARQNAQNRELGLAPGEAQSFTNNFEKAGGDEGLLARIAQAKTDPSKWAGLQAAGISPQEIQSEDPTQIAAQFLQRAGAKFKQMGPSAAMWANNTHVSDFADVLKLNKAASYGDADYAQMGTQFKADIPRLAVRQQQLDQGTAAKAQFDTAFDEAKTALYLAFVKLAPQLTTLTTEFADAVKAFSQSGELQKDVDALVSAFAKAAKAGDWVATKLNALFPGSKDASGADDDRATLDGGGVLAKGYGAVTDWYDALRGNPHKPTDVSRDIRFGWPWDKPSTNSPFSMPGGTGGDDQRVAKALPVISDIESRGNANAVSPAGAQGQYQLMPATAKALGVDPFDPVQARAGAAKLMTDYLKRYRDMAKALAAYNWGPGNLDKDLKAHPADWRAHLPAETQKYLQKATDRGLDVGGASSGIDVRAILKPLQDLTARMSAGAGAKYVAQDVGPPRSAMNKQQSPFLINVSVSTPPGSNTAVTFGGIPQ